MSKDLSTLVGRILIALLFVPSGFGKLTNFEGTVGYIASKSLPLPQVGAVVAIAVELGLGLLLLVGWKARWAALIMALFTIAAGLLFHNYWAMPPDQAMGNRINFFKNLAIAGGLLFVYAFGPGRLSVDKA
ncbi:MAG: DoxX family protein [Proteobacteria bacterium]|nr:DoxX family protein [Pseudomonadota bacterium]